MTQISCLNTHTPTRETKKMRKNHVARGGAFWKESGIVRGRPPARTYRTDWRGGAVVCLLGMGLVWPITVMAGPGHGRQHGMAQHGAQTGEHSMQTAQHGGAMTGHAHSQWVTPPPAYAVLRGTRWDNPRAIEQGRILYKNNCALCHGDVEAIRAVSNHQGVSCEVCHGAAANHVASPMETKPPIDRERTLCTVCHTFNPSRPSGFPQIDPVAHNPTTPCVACHLPHAPEPPTIPGECSVCHGQIARQKAVSHHAGLPCTTCHEAPDEHKASPRSVRPTKPLDRAFCGACHSEPAMVGSGIPQVDIGSHWERYLCWQCHYPHSPEIGS